MCRTQLSLLKADGDSHRQRRSRPWWEDTSVARREDRHADSIERCAAVQPTIIAADSRRCCVLVGTSSVR
ncbi:MAG: hypothetical protein M3R63_25165, partial [Actinomycetota bacterium]|nr:hypothetical protein [Actinomycetota bacterium]